MALRNILHRLCRPKLIRDGIQQFGRLHLPDKQIQTLRPAPGRDRELIQREPTLYDWLKGCLLPNRNQAGPHATATGLQIIHRHGIRKQRSGGGFVAGRQQAPVTQQGPEVRQGHIEPLLGYVRGQKPNAVLSQAELAGNTAILHGLPFKGLDTHGKNSKRAPRVRIQQRLGRAG
eukprot:scaffold2637_cov421-Pavlova_lutheri.AAC.8